MIELCLALFGVLMYLAPTVLAYVRVVPNRGSLMMINLFFGWTIFGWLIAFAWACADSRKVQ